MSHRIVRVSDYRSGQRKSRPPRQSAGQHISFDRNRLARVRYALRRGILKMPGLSEFSDVGVYCAQRTRLIGRIEMLRDRRLLWVDHAHGLEGILQRISGNHARIQTLLSRIDGEIKQRQRSLYDLVENQGAQYGDSPMVVLEYTHF